MSLRTEELLTALEEQPKHIVKALEGKLEQYVTGTDVNWTAAYDGDS